MHSWNPQAYLTYADERGRPFLDLLARVDAVAPRTIVDLGCGPGNLTRLLATRWPGAGILGLDSSPEMIAAAISGARAGDSPQGVAPGAAGSPQGVAPERAENGCHTLRTIPGVGFAVADLTEWEPDGPVDVVVSNATLQWVPGHLELLPRLFARVAPGGWFAFQVPGNFGEPSHTIRTELAADPRFAAHTTGVPVPSSHEPAAYWRALAGDGVRLDVWETTYLHVLTGPDPVFEWVSGTGARPTLQALPADLRAEFEDEFRARLRAAYPATPHGVVLPFRRIFVVAHKEA